MKKTITPPGQGAPTETLATTDEVATYLRIPKRTLEKWRLTGDGPDFRRLGIHVRYSWADVRAWEKTRTTTSKTA